MQLQLEQALRAARNDDGGWGYHPRKSSRLEPTCWALLALNDADPQILIRWPTYAGLLAERPGGQPNLAFHALALFTLAARRIDHAAGTRPLVDALHDARGIQLKPSTINRQDNSLQGWSWIPATFSWVEPTAWSLIALKRWARLDGQPHIDRIREGEALLLDRCCAGGGWNYGNANMLGQELKPYVPTTALALLALQDRRQESVVARSAEYLGRAARSESSALALSLAALALGVFGQDVSEVQQALNGQAPTTLALENNVGIATALVALRKVHEYAAFVL